MSSVKAAEITNEEKKVAMKSRQGTWAFFRGLTRTERATLLVLGFAQFSSQVAFSCIVPFFPTEAAQKGLSSTQIGFLIGVFQLVSFLASPLLGRFMAQLGQKRLFASGLLLGGFSAILFGCLRVFPSGSPFFYAALVVRMMKALGSASFATSSLTIVAQSFPGKLASVMSLMEICSGIGFTLGPLLGSALYELGGYSLPFFVLGSMMASSGLVFALFLLITRRRIAAEKGEVGEEKHAENEGTGGGWAILAIPELWLTFWAILTMEISCFFYDAPLAAHLADLGGRGSLLVGMMISLVSCTYLLSAPFAGWLVDRWPAKSAWLMFAGSLLSACAILLMGPSPWLPLTKSMASMAVSFALLGFGISAIWIPTFPLCIEAAKERGFSQTSTANCGLISGTLQAAASLGAFLGATLGGASVSQIGFPWTSTLIAGLHSVWFSFQFVHLLLRRRRRKRRRELREELACSSPPPNGAIAKSSAAFS